MPKKQKPLINLYEKNQNRKEVKIDNSNYSILLLNNKFIQNYLFQNKKQRISYKNKE